MENNVHNTKFLKQFDNEVNKVNNKLEYNSDIKINANKISTQTTTTTTTTAATKIQTKKIKLKDTLPLSNSQTIDEQPANKFLYTKDNKLNNIRNEKITKIPSTTEENQHCENRKLKRYTTKSKNISPNKTITGDNLKQNNNNNNISYVSGSKRLTQGCTSLMYACQQGHTGDVVKELRTKPEKIYHRDRRNKNALHYCSGQNNLVAAASLTVAAPELLESADEDGFTPLHLAVIQGNLAMVNLLLANKADVNAVDNEGHSVVHWATVCGEVEALRSVLQSGANIATPDINGGSPLHYAAQMCGANYEGKVGQSSTKLAVEILTLLLEHPESSVDVTDKDGRQPILWAASAGSAKAVLALVKAGARVESSDKDGLTALHCAASRGHTECIDTIISLCGAPTDLIDSNGCTSLHYAVTLGHADATSRLLDLEADPNRQDRKGRTPAHCGCAKGQWETVKLLKEHGANLWLRNAKGDLPIHEAATSGRRELVEWLLDMKPKQVNTTSNDGRTMLHIAAGNDYTDMCKMLFDYGADVNCVYRNNKGIVMTPLDCSLQKGHRSTAKFLQSINGLPSSKLRLSARRPNAFNEQDLVKPLKYVEKEEINDLKAQKKYITYGGNTESDSGDCSCSEHLYKKEHRVNHVCRHHRKKFRRRTSSCGEVNDGNGTVCRTNDESDICRSKSNIEIRRKRSRDRIYSSDENDSCEVCCKHKRRMRVKKKDKYSRNSREILPQSDEEDTNKVSEKKELKRSKKDLQLDKIKDAQTGQHNIEEQKKSSRPSSSNIKKQRPQSAKKRQTKETTFNKPTLSPNENKILPTAAALDLTDDDDIVNSEIVVTEVQVHKENEIQSQSEEKPDEASEKNNVVEEISREVNEVLKNAAETVESLSDEKIIEQGEHLLVDKVSLDLAEQKNEESKVDIKTQNIEQENKVLIAQEESKSLEQPDSGLNEEKSIKPTTPPEVNETENNVNSNNTPNEAVVTLPLEEQLKQETPKSPESATAISDTAEQLKPETPKSPESATAISDTVTKMDVTTAADKNEEKVAIGDDTTDNISREDKIIIAEKPPSASKKETKISTKSIREQEGRKSFTLLPDSPGDVSVVDEKTVRKSSFTVLKSDGSVDVEDGVVRFEDSGEKSFKVVGEKSPVAYSSGEPDEIDDNAIGPLYSDDRHSAQLGSGSEYSGRKRRLKRRIKSGGKSRTWQKQSDDIDTVQQANKDQDSGFEPSPRALKTKIPSPRSIYTAYVPRKTIFATLDGRSCSSRLEGRKPGDKSSCNMTAVTRSIHRNIRRYYMERKIFQHLLELKSLQIRSSKLNESVLVKRAVDDYHKSCIALGAETGGTLRRYPYTEYTFKNFEMFLYETLKTLQKPGTYNFQNINEVYEEAERRLSPDYNTYEKALRCTTKTHRCLHAAHAYTGIPCAAYIPMMNHHTMPKFGFGSYKKNTGVGSFYLPKILTTYNSKSNNIGAIGTNKYRSSGGCGTKVSLELSHGKNKQLISLPSNKLDSNKRYYVTFTVKGSGEGTVTTNGKPDSNGNTTTKIELSDTKISDTEN